MTIPFYHSLLLHRRGCTFMEVAAVADDLRPENAFYGPIPL